MPRPYPRIALIYDFDGTLAPGNMHEFNFIPELGVKPEEFWAEAKRLAKDQDADEILAYMRVMLKKAGEKELQVRKEAFAGHGSSIKFFPGVLDWFDRIDKYARDQKAKIAHYIVSSGIREMIVGTPIHRHFARVFASSFIYDANGVACWPGVAVNYTGKTQFLFRINKGVMTLADDKKVNEPMADDDRPVPFRRMIYIGDGTTDVPCMKLVKDKGGHSVAVYPPRSSMDTARGLVEHDRVNFIAAADYREGSDLDTIIKEVIQKVVQDEKVLTHRSATLRTVARARVQRQQTEACNQGPPESPDPE